MFMRRDRKTNKSRDEHEKDNAKTCNVEPA
jgi:hypothetical protein